MTDMAKLERLQRSGIELTQYNHNYALLCKNNILHFLTNGYQWHRLVSDLHKKCSPLHFQSARKILLNLKKKSKVIKCQRGRLIALSPMEVFIVMLIKV